MLEWIATSCFAILAVLALRAALGKRISANLRYALWVLVLVRLLVPVQFFTAPMVKHQVADILREESLYVLPMESIPVEDASNIRVAEDGTISDANSFGYTRLENGGETFRRYAARVSPLELFGWLWQAGAVLLGTLLLAFNLHFAARLRRVRKPLEGAGGPIPAYVAEGLPSPCLFGLFRTAVYVTPQAADDPAMLRHVTAHELTHYRHLDHLWSVLRGAALAVHWWNPLVWLAVVLSRRDGELACDESALRQLGDGERKAYGETLLALVTAKSRPGDLLSFATTMTGGHKSLQERIRRIAYKQKFLVSASIAAVLLLSVVVVCAFGGKEADVAEPVGESAFGAEGDPLPYSPDLDRDGEPEVLYVRELNRSEETEKWRLEILRQSSEFLWSDTLDESRSGCGTYFLYRQDGLDYLMEYLPKMQQGYCTYTYRLFHFEDGEEVTDVQKSVKFGINFESQDHGFDPVEIAAFMQEVNELIDGSHLLLNTNHWMLCLEEDAEGRTRDNILTAIHYNGDTDYHTGSELLAALTAFADYAADHPDDVDSALNQLLIALEPEDISGIYGNNNCNVTVSEVVPLLKEAVPNRLSRFHEYRTFAEEETWMWSMAVLAGFMENGGTLYMLACDSGSVELAYETADSCTSAFYESDELYTLVSGAGKALTTDALPYTADLDRDGSQEHFWVRSDLGGMNWSLQCVKEDGEKIWTDYASTSHAGYNSLFLCSLDGQDYLLRYNPYMSSGICSYQYQLFYLEDGREMVVQENSLSFDINFGRDFAEYHQFEPREIASFMDEINALLENSVWLLSTDPELLLTFRKEGRDSLWWLDDDGFTRDNSKSLLENLVAYRNYGIAQAMAQKEPSVVNTYDVTDSETIIKYYEMSDGTWKTDDYTYQYRLEITGRVPNASKDTTFIYLSNIEDITFEQAWRASGLSSNIDDYFGMEDAILVAMK